LRSAVVVSARRWKRTAVGRRVRARRPAPARRVKRVAAVADAVATVAIARVRGVAGVGGQGGRDGGHSTADDEAEDAHPRILNAWTGPGYRTRGQNGFVSGVFHGPRRDGPGHLHPVR
jgi:hypothetical protein